MNVKKILKIIGIIVLILVILVLIHTIRNFIIISKLQNNISKYKGSTNYNVKSITTEENGTIAILNYYKKDNNQVLFLERKQNEETTKVSMYGYGERIDTFIDDKDSKTVRLNAGSVIAVNIINQVESDNLWQTIFMSLIANIRKAKVNNKDCYAISNLLVTNIFSKDKQIEYLEKETGLSIKTETHFRTVEREYEFDNVDDSIFIEPDINQYAIQ